jgi:hypothetical protein
MSTVDADCVQRAFAESGTDVVTFTDSFVGDAAAELIAEGLRHDTSKLSLQLRGNYVGGEGAAALADALKVNSTLQRLSLEWNRVGE